MNTSTVKRRNRGSTARRPGEGQALGPVPPPNRHDPGGEAARRNGQDTTTASRLALHTKEVDHEQTKDDE